MNYKIFDKTLLNNRKPSIDIYRGIAIILVVLFHFKDIITIGFIGVDLFFVISGYLVSGVLIKELFIKKKVNWKSFLIKRVTKILPSYYFFLAGGLIIARIVLLPEFPEQVISIDKISNFILFYANYDMPLSRSFALTWSICVEEHFYLFLISFILIVNTITISLKKKKIFKWTILSLIIISILFKIAGQINEWETYISTHMRMDALFLGVLLAYQEKIEGINTNHNTLNRIIGGVLFILSVYLFYSYEEVDYTNGILHTIVPISFYFIIKGTLYCEFNHFTIIRYIAYYSYNWYLWHVLVGFIILNKFNLPTYLSIITYLLVSFTIAVLITKLIEEPIIKLRSKLINK